MGWRLVHARREQVMTEERDYRETPSEDEAEREAEGERREAVAGAQARPAPGQGAGGDRPEFSRSHLQSLLERGRCVDGAGGAASQRCAPASASRSTGRHRGEPGLPPEAMALAIVYEDEHLLVVDKPAGLVVHPAAGNWTARCSTACWPTMPARPLPRAGIVHRLDKDTSGLMVVAKTLVP
jgi:23S rRNA pseudouridine1911/1915/1917 synthase